MNRGTSAAAALIRRANLLELLRLCSCCWTVVAERVRDESFSDLFHGIIFNCFFLLRQLQSGKIGGGYNAIFLYCSKMISSGSLQRLCLGYIMEHGTKCKACLKHSLIILILDRRIKSFALLVKCVASAKVQSAYFLNERKSSVLIISCRFLKNIRKFQSLFLQVVFLCFVLKIQSLKL